jgi:hypothetical protein
MASPNRGRKLVQDARKLQELLNRSKLSLRAIARRRNVSPASLSQLMAISRLPDDILNEVEKNPELASKTKLAMLARSEGAEREKLWQRIQNGVSSDTLRNRKRGPGAYLSPKTKAMIDDIGHSLRRELAGHVPPGAVGSDRIIEFSIELLTNLWKAKRDDVVETYLDFVEREEGLLS